MTRLVPVARSVAGHDHRPKLRIGRLAALLAGVCAVPAAWAQDSAAARSTTLVPSVSVSETYTNNALLRDADRRGDLITQLTAGLSLSHRSARVTGSLDYSVSGSAHARETKANDVTQGLRAQLRGELLSNWLYIESSASISQQTISAFGLQTTDTAFDNPNRTEVRSLNVSPYLLRPLGTWGQIEARLQHARQSAASSNLGDSNSNTGSLVLSSQGAPRLGWSASAVRQRVDYETGRQSTTDTLRVGLTHRVDADLRLSGSVGRDKSDVVSVANTHSTTWGLGVEWLPSERTQFVLQRDQRYFGDGHRFVYSQRLSRARWSLSSSRDVSSGATSFVPTSTSTMFGLFYAMLATEQPDPLLRAVLVLQRLAALGISPTAEVTFGFLNSQVTLVSRQDASFAWQGLRTSFSASAYRSDSRRLDEGAQTIDPLGGTTQVRQHGYSLTLGHKLTPVTGISLTFSEQRTADAGTTPGNVLRSMLLNWTTQLGRAGNLSLGARRADFDSASNPYTENAVFATYGVRF